MIPQELFKNRKKTFRWFEPDELRKLLVLGTSFGFMVKRTMEVMVR
jgi:hypothetical protein